MKPRRSDDSQTSRTGRGLPWLTHGVHSGAAPFRDRHRTPPQGAGRCGCSPAPGAPNHLESAPATLPASQDIPGSPRRSTSGLVDRALRPGLTSQSMGAWRAAPTTHHPRNLVPLQSQTHPRAFGPSRREPSGQEVSSATRIDPPDASKVDPPRRSLSLFAGRLLAVGRRRVQGRVPRLP